MADHETCLNQLFVNAGQIMDKLGDTFTTYAFIRLLAQREQAVYITLLMQYVEEKKPFIAANNAIETRLQEVAPHYGYLRAEERTLDTDIFGKLQKVALYRRVSDLVASDAIDGHDTP